MIQGKHSFHNFVSMGSNVKTTIREVYECDLTIINPHDILVGELFKISIELTECYELRIVGSGFLKQMVRHLMSAMWLVGNGRMSLNDFDYLLNGPIKDKRLWKVASSRGLHLYKFN
jgi:tRNA pseudouridine38-40 synthase